MPYQGSISIHRTEQGNSTTADQLDSAVQDVHGMITSARRAAITGDQDAVAHILELAENRLDKDVIPATMAAAAASDSDAAAPRPVGTMLVDQRRFYGALRILDDAILAADVREEETGALSLVTDCLRDAADPAKLGN